VPPWAASLQTSSPFSGPADTGRGWTPPGPGRPPMQVVVAFAASLTAMVVEHLNPGEVRGNVGKVVAVALFVFAGFWAMVVYALWKGKVEGDIEDDLKEWCAARSHPTPVARDSNPHEPSVHPGGVLSMALSNQAHTAALTHIPAATPTTAWCTRSTARRSRWERRSGWCWWAGCCAGSPRWSPP
jgi:hypothetical protein